MDSPGKYLKKQRELRNLSIKEVSKSIRVKEKFLLAIEEDRYDLLPSPVYVKGFLTIYARYLGLDPNEVTQSYKNYLNSLKLHHTEEVKLEIKKHKKRFLLPLIIFFSILIFTLLLFLWSKFERPSPTNEVNKSPSSDKMPIPIIFPPEQKALETQLGKKEELEEKLKEKRLNEIKEAAFEIIEAAIGTGINIKDERVLLTGQSSEFFCNNQKVYFFTRIKTDKLIKVSHVWLWRDKEFHKIEMEVKPPIWSIYSYLTLRPNYSGDWRVEARYGDKTLKSLNFKALESH